MSHLEKYVAPVGKINNLEGADITNAPTPATWEPWHIQRCLLAAFAVDRAMPKIGGPKDPGSAHPQISYTEEEIAEQLAMAMAEEAAGTRDKPRPRPTLAEIEFMETCFAWLLIVRRLDTQCFFALRMWLRVEQNRKPHSYSGASHRKVCKRIGIEHTTFIRRKERALKLISSSLIADCVPVLDVAPPR